MARKDDLTGKKALKGNLRSHALNATKRKFNLNLHEKKVFVNGQTITLKVSAKTARTIKNKGLKAVLKRIDL